MGDDKPITQPKNAPKRFLAVLAGTEKFINPDRTGVVEGLAFYEFLMGTIDIDLELAAFLTPSKLDHERCMSRLEELSTVPGQQTNFPSNNPEHPAGAHHIDRQGRSYAIHSYTPDDKLILGRSNARTCIILMHTAEESRDVFHLVDEIWNRQPEQRPSAILAFEFRLASLPESLATAITHCKIRAWGNALPRWEDYDSIQHFTDLCYEDYEGGQNAAIQTISNKLISYGVAQRLSSIVDLGCGAGELLSGVGSQLKGFNPNLNLVGVDISQNQIDRALREFRGKNIEFLRKSVDDVEIPDPDTTLLMCLGNTMAHIGSRKLRYWLEKLGRENRLPKWILCDFAKDWRDLLEAAEVEPASGPIIVKNANSREKAITYINTSSGPGFVKRAMIVQFIDKATERSTVENALDWSQHRFFVKQFADAPSTYHVMLGARGFKPEFGISPKISYFSGWGSHDLELWSKSESGSAWLDWPTPSPDDIALNQPWYSVASDIWSKFPKSLKHPMVGSEEFSVFPVAILPFGSGGPFARYVNGNNGGENEPLVWLFSAWSKLVDPGEPELKAAGVVKGDQQLPYAPSLSEVLRGSAPSPYIRHFDFTHSQYRLDMNAYDVELADLERKWIMGDHDTPNGGECYFALPLYVDSLPILVLVVRSKSGGVDSTNYLGRMETIYNDYDSTLMVIWREHRDKYVDDVVGCWLNAHSALSSDHRRLKDEVSRVHKSKSYWTSWIRCKPGESIVASPKGKAAFNDINLLFKDTINSKKEQS
jgi:SAM-dependent methyltransferase